MLLWQVLKECRDAGLSEEQAEAENARLDDTIELQEFRSLFTALDLSLTDGQLDRFFAICDLNGSATISKEVPSCRRASLRARTTPRRYTSCTCADRPCASRP